MLHIGFKYTNMARTVPGLEPPTFLFPSPYRLELPPINQI